MREHPQGQPTDGGDDREMVELAYEELRDLARGLLRREHDQLTLQTTALVHEAYLKLAGSPRVSERGRSYFFGAAVRAMRQILVDAARRRGRDKRGGGVRPVSFDEAEAGAVTVDERVLWVHDALERFAAEYPRHARVVECRFFGGLSVEETAQVLETSTRTVKRDWAFAQAWLYREWSP